MSKSKGNAYERKICEILSHWWSGGTRSDLFWRTSNSGGRATTRAKKNKQTSNAHSDIAANDPSAQPLIDFITFEIKRGYNRFTIQDLLDKPLKSAEQKYEEWFRKAQVSAKLAGTPHWMVIVQRDRREALAIFSVYLEKTLDIYETEKRIKVEVVGKFDVVCIPLREFLEIVDPREIEGRMKKCL